jgi:branched-chain amino acid transport system substrate-binding protein
LRNKFMAATSCLVAALALGVTACGDDGDESGGGGGTQESTEAKTVTVYSSLPLQGASRDPVAAVVNGAKLALEQAGNKAGNITVKYVSLDDSTAQAGQWTAEATSANARKAAQDDTTAVYIGEFNSGASAVSIPILNEGGVPQISPANTGVGLTVSGPGATAGEPDKYYPTGKRTYTRIVAKDSIQGPALVTLMKDDGCTKIAVANDKEVYGAGLAAVVEASAKDAGLEVTANDAIDTKAANYRSLASKAKTAGADCFVFGGVTASNAVQLYKDFASALPEGKLYGPDGVCESAFVDSGEGGIPAELAPRFKCTVASLPNEELPPEGQEFISAFSAKYGTDKPDPYAIYGYEAMALALDAIKRSGTGSKEDVLKALFETKDRASVLGTYSIDENGDTTLSDYAVYSIEDDALKFDQILKGSTQ